MNLISNLTAIAPLITTSFKAIEGVPPYTYSVVPGGAGGSIDASTGLYTAPASGGMDTVKVIDANLDEAEKEISILTPMELVCDIIRSELGLDADQVHIYQTKFTIPKDQKMYIAVSVLNSKCFANNNHFENGEEVQVSNWQDTLSIEILSRSTEALIRKEEVVMALASFYSENQQTANSFKIGKIPTGFVNLSEEDGAAIPYRFNISLNILYAKKKVKPIKYYDHYEEPTILEDK